MEKVIGRNNGIIVAGGTLNANQIAVGEGANINIRQANSSGPAGRDLHELYMRMDELIALVRQDTGCVSAGVDTALEVARKEIATAEPDKIMVTSILDHVAKHAGSVSTIVSCLDGLRKLVALVL